MHTINGEFKSQAIQLFFQSWMPEAEPKAVMMLLHGACEHSGRYTNLVGPLVKNGFSVWAYDHLGCGSSPGQRGHIHTWEDFRSGVRAFSELVATKNPNLPIFLYGHSMGALVVLDFIQDSPDGLSGAILSGTPIDPAGVSSSFQRLLARLLSRIKPNYSLDLGLDPNSLSRDPRVVQAYRDDPLVQRYVTVRWGAEAMAVQQKTSSRPDLVRLPVLFIHGSNDPLNRVSGVRSFCEQIPHLDKQLLVYEGSLHEPHNDLDHEQVASDLVGWLDRHLQQDSQASSALEPER